LGEVGEEKEGHERDREGRKEETGGTEAEERIGKEKTEGNGSLATDNIDI